MAWSKLAGRKVKHMKKIEKCINVQELPEKWKIKLALVVALTPFITA